MKTWPSWTKSFVTSFYSIIHLWKKLISWNFCQKLSREVNFTKFLSFWTQVLQLQNYNLIWKIFRENGFRCKLLVSRTFVENCEIKFPWFPSQTPQTVLQCGQMDIIVSRFYKNSVKLTYSGLHTYTVHTASVEKYYETRSRSKKFVKSTL